jgi:hypothetical protein
MNFGAHRLQAADMDIDGTSADCAAAWQRDVGPAVARKQRTQHDDGRAHRTYQLVGSDVLMDRRWVDLDTHLVINGYADAHLRQQLDHRGHIVQMRHIADRHRLGGEQCARKNWQSRVLGPRNPDLAFQRHTAVYL